MTKNTPHFVESLINLGISEREAKVYLALLKKKNATISDLQKLSGIRQNRIYEIISNLLRQGFCTERREGQKRTYEAVDPQVTLNSPIQTLEECLKQSLRVKEELHALYSSTEKVKEPFEYIEIIHGNDNIHNKFLELLRSAKFDYLDCTRPPFAFHTEDMREEQNYAFYEFLKRGGKAKSIYEVNEYSIPQMYKMIKENEGTDVDFRIAKKLPLKMSIFDRQTLLIADKSSLAGEGELSMTVIKQKVTVKGYIALFDFLWEQSEKYAEWIVDKESLMESKLAEFEKSFAL